MRAAITDKMFHLLIAGATQNQMLLDSVESIWLHRDTSPLWKQLHATLIRAVIA